MNRQFLFTLTLWGIALLAVGSLTGTARATCGDYVHLPANSSVDSLNSKPKVPCHGPNCSADPSTPSPPMPPASSTVQTSTIDVLLMAHDQASDSIRLLWPNVTNVTVLSCSLSAIFHPPRLI